MLLTADPAGLDALRPGDHVCWVVDDPATYVAAATAILEVGRSAGERPFVFGPEGSADLDALRPLAAVATDPDVAFLGGGPLVPDAMFSMFREQVAIAKAEGFRGLRLVADMDWLRPLGTSTQAVVAFELLLDRVVHELGATVVCAYRTTSFDPEVISGVRCVHPREHGVGEAPQFRMVAGDTHEWRLSGEVDFGVASAFVAAVEAATHDGPCVVDVAELDFIDVAGMRAIAIAARSTNPVVLKGATSILRRGWTVAGFDSLAPGVQLVA